MQSRNLAKNKIQPQNKTYHFLIHPVQLNFQSCVYLQAIFEFHCRLVQAFVADLSERNSESRKKKKIFQFYFLLQMNDTQIP